jgi:hypothetical protein
MLALARFKHSPGIQILPDGGSEPGVESRDVSVTHRLTVQARALVQPARRYKSGWIGGALFTILLSSPLV